MGNTEGSSSSSSPSQSIKSRYEYGFEYNGKRYAWSQDQLDRSRVNVGNVNRLRNLLCKLQRGEKVTVVALGASVTDGNGLKIQEHKKMPTFANRMEWSLNEAYPLKKEGEKHKYLI